MLGTVELPLTVVLWIVIVGFVVKLILSAIELIHESRKRESEERWAKIVRGERH